MVSQASWAETDKGANKKLARASAAEQKAAEAERIRQEKKALEEADNAESGAVHDKAQAKKTKQTPGKLTRAQIQQNMALMAAAAGAVLHVDTDGDIDIFYWHFIHIL